MRTKVRIKEDNVFGITFTFQEDNKKEETKKRQRETYTINKAIKMALDYLVQREWFTEIIEILPPNPTPMRGEKGNEQTIQRKI